MVRNGLTNIDICNMALDKLGVQSIRSFEDSTTQANMCSRYYDQARKEVLRAHDWTFAKRDEALALLNMESGSWQYLYVYPDDCEKVLTVYGEGQKRLYKGEMGHFDIFSPRSEVTVIGTDIGKAYLEYIYDVRNVDKFSSEFVSALTFKLACAMNTLSASSSALEENMSLYQDALQRAAVSNRNEVKERVFFRSAVMDARGYDG